jgi:large subunit ribosomal protein L30
MGGRLRVTLRKSVVSTTKQARGTVRALGLDRIGHTVELPDTPATRGMVRAVRYLVTSEEIEETAAAPSPRRASRAPKTEEDGS